MTFLHLIKGAGLSIGAAFVVAASMAALCHFTAFLFGVEMAKSLAEFASFMTALAALSAAMFAGIWWGSR